MSKETTAPAQVAAPEIGKETQQKYFEVDFRNIRPIDESTLGIKNLRTDYGTKDGSFEELVNSLDVDGPKEAMKGFRNEENPEIWHTISGHTRTKAAHELFKRTGKVLRFRIQLVPVKNYKKKDFLWDMYLSNKQREMNILETANMVVQLLAEGETKKELAKKMNKHTHFITNLEILANSPKRMRDAVAANVISYTEVVKLMQNYPDPTVALEKLEKALGLAKLEKKGAAPDAPQHEVEDETSVEVSAETHAKISKRHIDKVTNKVDSIAELKRVFKAEIDKPRDVADHHLYSVLKQLVDNKLTAQDISNMLFVD